MNNKWFAKVLLLFTISISSWFIIAKGRNAVIFYGDALGYYLYLPASFIHGNHKNITKLPEGITVAENITHYFHQMEKDAVRTKEGVILNQYTYAVALLEAPFFFVAHTYENLRGLPGNGFSDTYSNLIKLSTLVYAVLGLVLAFKTLRHFYNVYDSISGSCLIFIGTNLFWFTLYQAGMAHGPLFFLYAALCYLSIQVYRSPDLRYFALLGLTSGLITIMRPTDILCLSVPLLFGITNTQSLKQRFAFIKEHRGKILIAAMVFVIPIIPQLMYWKMMTGSLIFYSYGEQGFNWLSPKIVEGLFHFNNGWLPYSPIMIFSLGGLLLFRHFRPFALPIYFLLPVYIYIIYSWYCYNYI